ncbi:cell wall-binding repeat-containing protein [Glaciibacter flavus]|uniref:cell wall-binding repeat-containing protein n=1 Tax=Orlajensenia flava TaxID=2565934 RepID=UPI003AFF860E
MSAAVASVVATGVLTPLAGAEAVGSSILQGTVMRAVTGGADVPATSARVIAYPMILDDSLTSTRGASANVDGLGHFSLSVEPGDYRLRFEPLDRTLPNALTWLGGMAYRSGSPIVHASTTGKSGLDATLPVASSISGNITYSPDVNHTWRYTSIEAFLIDPDTGTIEPQSWYGQDGYDPEGRYTIGQMPAGRYLLRFGDNASFHAEYAPTYWPGVDSIAQSDRVTVPSATALDHYDATMNPGGLYTSRLSGTDRYATVAAISKAGYAPGVPVVYVASGENFPDALSAGPAAAYEGGAVVLVSPTSIPAAVAAELQRLEPKRIVIMGGYAAVSAGVEAQLASYSPTVDRISGADRFVVSRAAARAAFTDGSDVAYLATGRNYPDALAASAAAGGDGAPVILVDGLSTTLDRDTAQLLADLGVRRVFIAGGGSVVSVGIGRDVVSVPGVEEVKRLAGSDRYQTAVTTGVESFPVADTAFLATGTGFADALAGAALAGELGAPLFLVSGGCLSNQVAEAILALDVSNVVVLGGTAVVSEPVAQLQTCEPLPL